MTDKDLLKRLLFIRRTTKDGQGYEDLCTLLDEVHEQRPDTFEQARKEYLAELANTKA